MTLFHAFFYEKLLKLQKKVVILQAQSFKNETTHSFKKIIVTSYKKHKKIDI